MLVEFNDCHDCYQDRSMMMCNEDSVDEEGTMHSGSSRCKPQGPPRPSWAMVLGLYQSEC